MSTKVTKRMPRRANEVMAGVKARRAEPLFGEFWREGELALMFGEPGVGKSVLAVQIADALSRGAVLGGQLSVVSGKRKRRKVLFVDLVLSEAQFLRRYSGDPVEGEQRKANKRTPAKSQRRKEFSANFFYEKLEKGEELVAWVRGMVEECGIGVVVIDDLSMVSRTDDGTRETLELMHELRRLTQETGVSVLVLADSFPSVYGRDLSERDLRRSRVLCGVADSVFAVGGDLNTDKRTIMQTRSRSGEMVWTHSEPLRCTIDRGEDGFVRVEFHLPEIDKERRDLICDIKEMHDDEEMTFRAIADELEISKSSAQRLYAEWRPEFRKEEEEKARIDEEKEAYQRELENWRASGGKITWDGDLKRWVKAEERDDVDGEEHGEDTGNGRQAEPEEQDLGKWEWTRGLKGVPQYWPVEDLPFMGAAKKLLVTDLEMAADASGNEIYVQEWDPNVPERPQIWFVAQEKKGVWTKKFREPGGIHACTVGDEVELDAGWQELRRREYRMRKGLPLEE